ncbi:GntR family transcriptional regulator [Ruminococcaceae bacterium OttesenSCG-928-D13]|nr:GntR family transcriptional regulator [Ruminococcaceae bacterium OttesenSCG-928-D13]
MKSVAVKQTKDQIADLIRGDILSGTLKSGDELTQEQVAEQTGLSRMPVREAFQTLEQEGFLLRLPNRHMRVIEITDDNIRQYFTTLAALEYSFYQQLTAGGHSPDGFSDAVATAIETNSPDTEYSFHVAIFSAMKNEYLTGIHKKLLGSFYLHALHHYWKMGATQKSLHTIWNGIQKADGLTVEKGLAAYFSHYEKLMLKRKSL